MNPTAPGTRPSASRWWLWIIIPLGLMSVGLMLLAGAVWSSVRIGSDARALLASADAASGIHWRREVEISVGAVPLGLARTVLRFVHQAPPEAKTALRAVRSAEVGVYRAASGPGRMDPGAVLSATDKTMADRGWDRIVGVAQTREVVGIYVPRKSASERDVHACVLVLDGPELVVVSLRANFETLMELARNRPEWRQRWHPSVAR